MAAVKLNVNKYSWKSDADGDTKVACHVQWAQIFKQINKWREKGVMCDFLIKIKEEDVYCHKCVLGYHSEYFRLMFTSGLEDSKAMSTALSGYSKSIVDTVVQFMYTGTLKISNAQDLLMLADMWQVTIIKDICARFLEKHIDVSNCLGLWQLSKQYFDSSHSLYQKSKHLIMQQFPSVVKCDEFLENTAEAILEIVEWDDVNLGSKKEDLMFEAVLRWISKNPVDNTTLEALLNKVRIQCVSKEMLDLVEDETVRKYIAKNLSQQECNESVANIVSERQPHHYIYVIGGYIQSRTGPMCPRTTNVERYNLQSSKWEDILSHSGQIQHTPFLASQLFAFEMENRIMCCLYGPDQNDKTGIWEYNPVTNSWTVVLQSPSELLDLISICMTGGALYCGQTSTKCNNSNYSMFGVYGNNYFQAELGYDQEGTFILLGICKRIASSEPENHFENLKSFSLIELGNLLYVIGGSLVKSKTEMHSVPNVLAMDLNLLGQECTRWMPKCPMNECRAVCCAVKYNGHIYAIGGFNKFRLKTMEMYDSNSDQWTVLSEMNKHRTHFVAVPTEEGIFVCGGKSYAFGCGGARKVLGTSEMYNVATNTWTVTDTMSKARCMFTGVLL